MSAPSDETLRNALHLVAAHVAIERLDRLWVFPPKELGTRESGLVVLALLPDPTSRPDQRQVCTLRYEAPRRGQPPVVSLTDEALAPADRIPRVLEGVLARLGDADEPLELVVGGDRAAWEGFIDPHAAGVDPANRE